MISSVLIKDITVAMPIVVLTLGALFIMLFEVFFEKDWPKGLVTTVIFLIALVSLHVDFSSGLFIPGATVFGGTLYADPFVAFITFVVIIGSLLALMMGVDRLENHGIVASGEYYTLVLISAVGALIFASANELITLFLGLETMSMALYCLCGSSLGPLSLGHAGQNNNVRERQSAESALKYFLLGSFSSAFLLYGIALLYGLTGSTMISEITSHIGGSNQIMLALAMGLMIVGLLFKIGGVPFHFWAPDVYEGAPTPVTGYMACVIKAASFGAALRIIWVVFQSQILFWSGAIWYAAALTMLLGNVVAIRQRSVKRMLAYSSIAHAGYMLIGFLAPVSQFGGGPAILFYLIGYTVMTMGAFSVVLVVQTPHIAKSDSDDIVRFNGLASREPVLAALMSLFMLALAGLPPGMVGLLGKFYLFSAAVKADYTGLVVIGVLSSAISCYYYLRVIVAMYFVESEEPGYVRQRLGIPLASVLTLCALGVVFLGLFPSALYHRAAEVIQKL